jgi:hypothetical protein
MHLLLSLMLLSLTVAVTVAAVAMVVYCRHCCCGCTAGADFHLDAPAMMAMIQKVHMHKCSCLMPCGSCLCLLHKHVLMNLDGQTQHMGPHSPREAPHVCLV